MRDNFNNEYEKMLRATTQPYFEADLEKNKYRMALEKIKSEYEDCHMHCNMNECSDICITYRIKQIIDEVLNGKVQNYKSRKIF